jgi:hypothetical protein
MAFSSSSFYNVIVSIICMYVKNYNFNTIWSVNMYLILIINFTGYNKGDYEVDGAMGGDSIGGSRNVGGNKKKKDKKGGNNLNPESFYDAIKNFGAGGGKDAGTGGTGTAEPPSNKNPIQPKKAQVKKNKKKLITPDDINSLFGKAEVADENEDEDEEEVSVDSNSSMDTSVTASSLISGMLIFLAITY